MGRKPTKNLSLPPRVRARTQKSGKTYYYYDSGGKPRREIPLGNDYVLAVKKWAEFEKDENKRYAAVATFSHVAERYLLEVVPTKAPLTQRDNIKEITKLLEFFDNPPAPIDRIKPIHISQYMEWRKSSPTRANREKALFSHIFNKARIWGYTEKANPCTGIPRFPEKGRDIYVENVIYQAVLAVADQPLKDTLELAYLTGQRPSSVLSMAETDIRDGVLYVRQSKTGKKLRIAVKGKLATLLERIKARKGDNKLRVLKLIVNEELRPLTTSALRSRFDKARIIAAEANPELATEIAEFQIRDLRAKAGTDVVEKSQGNMRKAQKQLGHANLAMTEHYIRDRLGDFSDPTE